MQKSKKYKWDDQTKIVKIFIKQTEKPWDVDKKTHPNHSTNKIEFFIHPCANIENNKNT
jgi:hypothetical protein